MTLLELLDTLGQLRINLRAENGQLRIQAPQGVFTPELRAEVTQYKDEILAYLQKSAPAPSDQPSIVPNQADRYQPFPLTDIQHAYWIGQVAGLTLENSYHMYQEIDVVHLDLARLTQAWQRVIERHDMLRAIVLPNGQQQILAHVPAYQIDVLDLTGAPDAEKQERLLAIRDEMSHQILSLSEWPLFDIRVTRVNAEQARIHTSLAVIMMDGGSLEQMAYEWNLLYENPDAVLPALTLSYRDYVMWNVAFEKTASYQQARAYWMNRLDTLPPAPKLPARRAGAKQSDESTFVHRTLHLAPEKWQRLQQRIQQAKITQTALLGAAFAEVLSLWSEQPQFTLNCTFFNRPPGLHPELNDILGDFTGATLLEVDSTEGSTIVDRAKQIHRRLWQDLENRAFNGVRVIQELTAKQQHQVGPLMPIVFTSMIGLKSAERQAEMNSYLGGATTFSIMQTPQVSMDYQIRELGGGLHVTLDSVDGFYPEGMAADIFATYATLLNRLVDDDALWAEAAPNDAAKEGRAAKCAPETLVPQAHLALLAEINQTTAAYSDKTLHALFLEQVHLRPQAPAILTTARTLTYQEVYDHANAIGHWLCEQNGGNALAADSLVAIVMEKGWEQVVSVFGILLAGAAYVPIDPTQPPARQHYILEQGNVRFVLTQSALAESLVWPTQIPATQRLSVDQQTLATPLPPLETTGSSTDLAYVLYTSGSTGTPKGVMIEHGSVVNRMTDIAERFGLTPADRAIALTALHHDLSVFDLLCMLPIVGGAIVLPDAHLTRDPAHWAAIMAQHKVTLWNSVPAFLQMLVEQIEYAAAAPLIADLRWVILAGDFIPVTLPDRLRALQPSVAIIASGGPTETTVWDIYYPVGDVDPTWPSIPYGKPLKNARYYVLDDRLQQRPIWVPGELCIGGVGLARGYWQDEEKSAAKFVTDPRTGERLYRSGDLGRLLPDGNIEILGRTDFQVKIRGQRIELGEIEAHLLQHPMVKEAVVNTVDDQHGRRQLAAYIVPKQRSATRIDETPQSEQAANAATQAQDAIPLDQLQDVAIQDPVERLVFKLDKRGIRRFHNTRQNGASPSWETTSLAEIELPKPVVDEAFQAAYLARQSYRRFVDEPIPLATLSQLLTCLMPVKLANTPLPKYRYPSAGGLYPIQAYLYIKAGRVEGLASGFYYYHPSNHHLVLLTTDDSAVDRLLSGANQAIFAQGAFALFLVGDMDAIRPMYGGLAETFCLLEAGYISQLLMMQAPQHDLGFCPIGGANTHLLQKAFKLTEQHQLLHSLAGGAIDPQQKLTWLTPTEQVGAPTEAGIPTWQATLTAHLAQHLPGYMIPTIFVELAALPLNTNGKVDRKRLSDFHVEAPAMTFEAPSTELEEKLRDILQEISGVTAISVTQNFADFGLNSMHMVTVNNRLQEQLQQEMSVATLFEYSTIRDLATYLAGDTASTTERAADAGSGSARTQENAAAQTRRSERAQARLASRQRRR